ncbi:MAG: hypothetical protein IJK89_06030 [Clostridia bacterium]|nr:hypothetical protein [Clostridia bacterium]
MKKIIAILTVLALVLAAGCAGGTNDDADTTAPEKTSDATVADDVNETGKPQAGFLMYQAQYPQRAQYPKDEDFGDDYDALNAAYDLWSQDREAGRNFAASRQEGLNGFVTAMARALLENAQGDNKVCSPVNIYMALAMLAELTDGETRQELLDVLGVKDTEKLREQAKALWDANYLDDGVIKSLMGDSVWLNDGVNYKKDGALQTLAEDYFASVFSGQPGDPAYDDALHAWINEQTGGLLKDSAEGLKMDPLMMVTLVSTIYFKGRWTDTFVPEANTTETFHGAQNDATCEMMHETDSMGYYQGKGFSAVTKGVVNANGFRFILPDKGVSVDEVLASDAFADYLLDPSGEDYSRRVALSVPKFDVQADSDVIPTLEKLGVNKVFDHGAADFTPLTEDRDDIAVDQILHSARVKIDEEGCEAAAFTAIMACGASMYLDEPIDFTLDRPFIFVINGAGYTPLFVGVVNQP